jgi:elongation factor G
MSVTPENIRNIALVGYSKGGKTTLLETILAKTGAIAKAGKVDDGSSILDHDEIERDRQHTIDPHLAFFEKNGVHVNAIDTPGFRDFVGQVFGPLTAVELVVFVVDSEEGVRPHARKLWDVVDGMGLPRMVVIGRLDREGAKFEETLSQIQNLSASCVPMTVPIEPGPSLSGVEATYGANKGSSALAEEYGESFLESVVESNEALLEKYLGGEEIAPETIEKQIAGAVAGGTLYPVLSTSAKKDIGVDELIDAIVKFAPPSTTKLPRQTHPVDNPEETVETPQSGDDLCAHVFRTVSDPFVGKLSLVRVFAGGLAHNGPFINPHTGKNDKVGKIVRMNGKEQVGVDEVGTGDIVALMKLESLHTFDTLCTGTRVTIDPPKLPTPMYGRALQPKTRGDEKKFSESLTKITDEDPSIKAQRDNRTQQMVVSGLSQLHLQAVINRLKLRFNVEVDVSEPKVPYLETISGKGDHRYRHKKQSGGSGEFAEVALRVEPLERGQQYEFENKVFGGSISESYVQSAQKGVKSIMDDGAVAGYPMVDIKVTVYDGKEHPVDSKDVAFQKAGREAFKAAILDAKPVILEPIVRLEVTFPAEVVGDITGDLNRRRARVQGMDSVNEFQTIKAEVPLAELSDYANAIGAMTGGQGTYEIEMSHYELAPGQVQQKIIEDAKAEAAPDKED